MNKRLLKKGLAAVFSAFMSISGVDPVFAEDSTNNANPETITVLYGIGPGSISVTQDGETTTYETTGEQKVLTLTKSEADSIQITATADDGTNVYHFDEYYAGAETDTEYIKTPTSTATQEIDFDGTKVVEIAFSDSNAMNAIMPLGAACSQGQYAAEGYAGMATFAMTQLGTPYRFNTQGFSTYDCSGLVARAAWAINWMEGWNIGSSTGGWSNYLSQKFQYDTYDLRNGYTPSSKTKRGDIVIFYEDASYTRTYHMAIMLDNTNMVGAINGSGQYAGVSNAISVPQWPTLGTYGHKDDAPYCRIFHLTNEVPTKVSVEKKSSKPEVTDGNSLYSLEGAEYAIYKDSGCTQQVATVTTDSTGKGTSGEFNLDASVTTLYAKETKAPANGTYKLNQSVIPFSVSNGHGSFEATDEPLNDPLTIQITKLSSDGTVVDSPVSMEGAQFTVKYYAGEYNKVADLAGVSPDKTWVLETKKIGNVYGAMLSDTYKVGGDSFYYNEYNIPVLYLGTLTVEETKAPAGYTTEGAVTFEVNGSTQVATEESGVTLFKLLNENDSVAFKTANGVSIDSPEITKQEEVIRGSLEIKKSDAETGDQPQGEATNLSAQFTLHNDNNYDAVMRDANGAVLGTAEANSDFNYTITTDNNGHWKSADGFLPVGNYTLRESGAPTGYNGTATTFSFSITENNRTIVCLDTFKNTIIRGGFKVQKNDSDLGATPQGSANLQISFNVTSNNDNPVIVNGTTYNKGDVVFSGKTDANGYFESPANLLPYGSYTLTETEAPAGYTSNGNTSTTFSVSSEGVLVDLTTQITNVVKRGGFKVQKNDSVLDNEAQGAADLAMEFEVVSDNANPVVVNGKAYKKGEVVFTGKTEKDGTFTSANDLLPYGEYTLNETKAPVGYTEVGYRTVSFKVAKEDQIVDLTDDITNVVIRGGFSIKKKDSETATRPQGDTDFAMTFEVVTNNDHPVVVSGKTYKKGDVVLTASTDTNGDYTSASDLLPYGNYTLNEVKPPVGYTSAGKTSVTFDITTNGTIVDLTNEINNIVVLGGVQIHKVFTDVEGTNWTENEPGAVFAVVRESYVNQYGTVADAIAHQYGTTLENVTDREWLYANLFAGSNTANTINKDGSNADLMTGHEYAVIKTDNDGNASTGDHALAYGRYVVEQLASGDNEITVSDAKYTVDINGDGQVISLQASNVPQTYFLRMVKKDADTGELVTLNSAEFKIFQLEDARGEEVNKYVKMKVGSVTYDTFRTTSDNGTDDLPSGTFYAVGENGGTVTTPLKLESGVYRIEEVATPEGFVTKDPITAEVRLENISEVDDEGNNFITVTIEDPRAYGELTINKTIEDVAADKDLIPGDTISKIEFTLTADEDIINPDDGSVLTAKGEPAKDVNGNVIGVFHPNAEGKATLTKIALGHYTLKETYIPDELATTAKTWDVDFVQPEDDRTTEKFSVSYDIENKPTYIELSKREVTGDDELPGAQISVIEKETGKEVDSYTSGDKPHSIKGLKRNTTYIMRETVTPNNGEYVKATEIEFTVNADGSVKTVVMVDKLMSVTKKDTNGEFVEGAEFTIYDKDGNVVDVWTSANEAYHIHNLVAGETYTGSETVVPDGYVKINDFSFTVEDDGKNQELDIVNKKVTALKVNVAGEPIEGAQMNVTDAAGNVVDAWVSGKTEHNINGLVENGSYVLNEAVAADGYVVATSIPFTVTGADDQNVKADQSLTMTDKHVEIQKVDMCGVDIDGAQLTVYELDSDGNIINETVTDEEGNSVEQPKVVDQWTTTAGLHHYVNGLVAGHSYVVVETFVPEGYTKAADYKFTVADDMQDQTEKIVNKQLLISKETVGGDEVEGAIITITDKETGEEVERFTTTDKPYETSNLEVGKTYILHEDTAPLGFIKATDVEFTVTDDGVDQTVTMIDAVEEVAKVDQNGDLLKGASLEAVDESGNVVEAWISGRHIVDLTDEQVEDLKNGKNVSVTLEDGRTATVYVTDANAKKDSDENAGDTDASEEETTTEEACEIKYAEPTEPAEGIEVTEDSDLRYTIAIDNADGTKEYVNIDLEGDETTHRLSKVEIGKTYTIREVEEVDGYYWAESQEMTANGTQDHVTTLIDNMINYRLNKVDDEGNPIAGVAMKLEDITDSENITEVELPNDGITTEDGFELSGVLIAGHHYLVTEERTVEGYSMPQVSTMEFVVPVHGSAEFTVINFVNLPNKIAVAKVDNYGEPLAGAKMQILSTKTDEETGEVVADEVLYEFTSEENPTDISDYVRGGDGTTYILREVEAPFGYEKIEDMEFTVNMAEPGTAQLIYAVDSLEHVSIKAVKVDQADHSKVLKGAELTLYTADGLVAQTVDGKQAVGITDDNGEIHWEVEYSEGMYVQETKAPEGYKLNSNYHEVKIEDDYSFIENDPIVVMVADEANPKTAVGGFGGLAVGTLVAGSALALLAVMRKKAAQK